jgi:hypothetical protein
MGKIGREVGGIIGGGLGGLFGRTGMRIGERLGRTAGYYLSPFKQGGLIKSSCGHKRRPRRRRGVQS